MISFLLATTLLFSSGAELSVEVAISPDQHYAGLSGRASLPENTGMLFVFDEPTTPTFTMRDMQFPLDFIWLNGDHIVQITPNVPTDSKPLQPATPVDGVIETNAGWTQSHNIFAGDTVTHSRFDETAPAAEPIGNLEQE